MEHCGSLTYDLDKALLAATRAATQQEEDKHDFVKKLLAVEGDQLDATQELQKEHDIECAGDRACLLYACMQSNHFQPPADPMAFAVHAGG